MSPTLHVPVQEPIVETQGQNAGKLTPYGIKNWQQLQTSGSLAVAVDPNGAITGNGQTATPLAVAVDGTTIHIVADKLAAINTGTVTNIATDNVFVSGGPITSTGTISATVYTQAAVDASLQALCGGL